jgi:hypothetical protein
MILKRGWQVVLLLTCMSCAGELDDPGRFGFLFDGDDGGTTAPRDMDAAAPGPGPQPSAPPVCVTALLNKSCGLAGCHNATAPQIDLASPGVQSRLVGKKSTSDECSNRTYVTTDGSPSLLIQKIMDSPPCGLKMPIGPALTTAETTCLTDWVDSLSN